MNSLRLAFIAALAVPTPAFAQYATGREVQFTVRIENVSTGATLKLSNGSTAPAPTAPVLWTVTDAGNPIFTPGAVDAGHGLRQLAEDGNPGVLADWIKANLKSVAYSGVATTPVGDSKAGPILPGKAYEFTFPAAPGQRLSLAMMFGQSNDLFYAPGKEGIALFDAKGKAMPVDATAQLQLWDAGTERNEEPGAGANQAPRQAAPGQGAREKKAIAVVKDAFTYPSSGHVVRVTIRPVAP